MRWYIARRGHKDGHNMTDTTKKESPWAEVLAHAEKLLQLVSKFAPKEPFNIPTAHMQVVVAMFWRARRLYDGVLVLLKDQLPEEAMFLARSLFEDSLRLQQLAEDVQNRDALILGWVNTSITEKRGLLEVAKTSGLETDFVTALASLEDERQELQKYAPKYGVTSLLSFLPTREAASKYGRKDDYWTYHWAHESVHGSDAVWMFARQRPAVGTVYLYARTGNPSVLSSFAHFSARSIADAAKAISTILGWTLPTGLEQTVGDIEGVLNSIAD